jgi:hypothetical protein
VSLRRALVNRSIADTIFTVIAASVTAWDKSKTKNRYV